MSILERQVLLGKQFVCDDRLSFRKFSKPSSEAFRGQELIFNADIWDRFPTFSSLRRELYLKLLCKSEICVCRALLKSREDYFTGDREI